MKIKITHATAKPVPAVSASLASHVSGPNSWNRSWEDSVSKPAGEELADAEKETLSSAPQEQMTRKLSAKRVVGDRSTLYEQRPVKRNPNAPLKPAGTFTNND